MKLLLDTHVFIWWSGKPDKLSEKVLDACENRANRLILSIPKVSEIRRSRSFASCDESGHREEEDFL